MSREELRRFLSWAEAPMTIDQQAVRLAVHAEAQAAGGDAQYTIVVDDEVAVTEMVGAPGVTAAIERLAARVVGKNAYQHERIYAELFSATRPAAGRTSRTRCCST